MPKFMCPPHAARTVLRAPQTADQLVEVPTIISCCSRLWSRKLPFQFVVVEGETLVFKVFFPDTVQQRFMVLWNALLSGLRSSSLVFLFLVEAFQIFAQDRFHPLLRTFQLVFLKLWMHFSPN